MSEAQGVGGSSGSGPVQGPKNVVEAAAGGDTDVQGLMSEHIRTLGDLKAAMVKHLGEEKGKKLYNTFMQSMAMQMLAQIRATAPKSQKWGTPGTPSP